VPDAPDAKIPAALRAEIAGRDDLRAEITARGKVVLVQRSRIALDDREITLEQSRLYRPAPVAESRVLQEAVEVEEWCPCHGRDCAPRNGRCGVLGAVQRVRCRCLGQQHSGRCLFAGAPVLASATEVAPVEPKSTPPPVVAPKAAKKPKGPDPRQQRLL